MRTGVFILVLMLIGIGSGIDAEASADTWPKKVLGTGADGISFVDNQVCQPCHPKAFQDWLGSHHDRAMQRATETTVLGDFNNVSLTYQGVGSHFFKRGGAFFVKTEGDGGKVEDFEVQYTFGVDPLQQYLIALPGGRLQSLPIAWDVQAKRWFHLYPDERVKPGDPLHWTGIYQNWNVMCAECHSTNLQKNYDAKTRTYQTTWSAVNVSCQACHGPGERHVKWAQGQKENAESVARATGLVIDFKTMKGPEQADQCARCHSRRRQVSIDDQHGRSLYDDFVPDILQEGLYHADGQILDEVYVYGSYLQSKMSQVGVACTDCHQPHRLELKVPGNALCTQCHQVQPNERFPTLVSKAYDTPAHHFHPVGSAGAQCVNCHMPSKTYMSIDARRDHSFRVPRPDLAAKLKTPDACTGCHQDRTASWAQERVKIWYSNAKVPHFAEVFALGRRGRPEAVAKLAEIAGAVAQPTIVRATALQLLRQYGDAGETAIRAGLSDPDPLIRVTAVGGLDQFPAPARWAAGLARLRDPVRSVRLEAARVLAGVIPEGAASEERELFDRAFGEFTALQTAMLDTPSAHLNLAVIDEQRGDFQSAERSYLQALQIDPAFLPARFNLANLYNRTKRNGDAERILREAIQRVSDEGELHYSLGLLLAEEQRMSEAAAALAKASQLMPDRARVHYNYGLVLQKTGQLVEAEFALLTSHRLEPAEPQTVYALAIHYIQEKSWDRAAVYAEKLVRLSPNSPGPMRMLRLIQQQQNR